MNKRKNINREILMNFLFFLFYFIFVSFVTHTDRRAPDVQGRLDVSLRRGCFGTSALEVLPATSTLCHHPSLGEQYFSHPPSLSLSLSAWHEISRWTFERADALIRILGLAVRASAPRMYFPPLRRHPFLLVIFHRPPPYPPLAPFRRPSTTPRNRKEPGIAV